MEGVARAIAPGQGRREIVSLQPEAIARVLARQAAQDLVVQAAAAADARCVPAQIRAATIRRAGTRLVRMSVVQRDPGPRATARPTASPLLAQQAREGNAQRTTRAGKKAQVAIANLS
jgi:hypothetical protein